MLVLALAILLATTSVATFPCWSYSVRWGYAPSVIAGTLLLCVAIVVVGGRSVPKAAEPEIAIAAMLSPWPVTSANGASRRSIGTVILEPETALP